MFSQAYRGKKVLLTGHTGFKGSWLTTWLLRLGAEVVGISRNVPTRPAMFQVLGLESKLKHVQADICSPEAVHHIMMEERPDFVFHLAAQAIVSVSYKDPVDTILSNVVGTMNVLDVLRKVDWHCSVVLITSDKCYDNVEWVWGYRETDALGGQDIYSGSKGAAELVIKSYFHSFFSDGGPVRLAVARAGNVIGGGDWAKDRIVVDAVRAWGNSKPVEIYSPKATRPWQHVLEPLSGYLLLGKSLAAQEEGGGIHGEAFNFGPKAEQNRSVIQLLRDLGRQWGLGSEDQIYSVADARPFHEAGLLKLNCDKALFHLQWDSNLEYDEMVEFVSSWYSSFYLDNADMFATTMRQITRYERLAVERKRVWADYP